MTPFIAVHAFVAALALVLGAVNLVRSAKGDPPHRLVGRIWMVAMYYVTLSSFGIQKLTPGHFSPIHILSVIVLATLTVAWWAARARRVGLHRGFVIASYVGLVGAFVGAVVVPRRAIPQAAIQYPVELAAAVLACLLLAGAVVVTAARRGNG